MLKNNVYVTDFFFETYFYRNCADENTQQSVRVESRRSLLNVIQLIT